MVVVDIAAVFEIADIIITTTDIVIIIVMMRIVEAVVFISVAEELIVSALVSAEELVISARVSAEELVISARMRASQVGPQLVTLPTLEWAEAASARARESVRERVGDIVRARESVREFESA